LRAWRTGNAVATAAAATTATAGNVAKWHPFAVTAGVSFPTILRHVFYQRNSLTTDQELFLFFVENKCLAALQPTVAFPDGNLILLT
jgi:hypothetical protein